MERQERQDASPAGEVLGEIVWLPEQAAKIVRGKEPGTGEGSANSWEQLSRSPSCLGQVMPVIINDWGSQARHVKIPLGILSLVVGLSQTPLVPGLTHSPAPGKCWSCDNWSEAGLAEPEERVAAILWHSCWLVTSWHFQLCWADTDVFHVKQKGQGRGFPAEFCAHFWWQQGSTFRACSFRCTVFFFCVIAQQPEGDRYRWGKGREQLIATANHSCACCGNYIHERRSCPAGSQSTAGAIWPSLQQLSSPGHSEQLPTAPSRVP